MKMQALYIAAVLSTLLFCGEAIETVPYEGLRLDISALTFNRDIIGTIIPGLNRTLEHSFPDIKEAGSFYTELHLTKIKITYYKINEERFDMNKFEYSYPIYKLKGMFESILFHISLEYKETWIGIPIATGTAAGAVTNVDNLILVLFNETDPDVQIPHPWDIKNMTHTGLWPPSSWIKSMLHTHFIPVFHKIVDDSMYDFAHKLLHSYRYIEDIFPEDIDLVFRNDIISVTPTVGGQYLTIAFKTNITVNNYIHKNMHRLMNGTVVPRGDFDYCLASQLVPDVMDAMGKGGYHDSDVSPLLWGFNSSEIREFFDIMPSLRERYIGNEEFNLHCQSSRFETTNDITRKKDDNAPLQLQFPNYCYGHVLSSGEYFVVVDVFTRFYYEMKCKDEGFYGHVLFAELYGFKTVPVLPEDRRRLLESHLKNFVGFFTDSELLSPGIKILPNRHNELIFDWAYIMADEICFYYKEKRPIMTPKT